MSEMKVALKGLTCANCAGKIEDTLSKLSETQEVSINLLRQEMTVKLAPNASAEKMQETVERVVHKFEPEVEVAFLQGQKAEHHHAHHEHCGCGCEEDDDDDDCCACGCGCGHDHDEHDHHHDHDEHEHHHDECGCDHDHDEHEHHHDHEGHEHHHDHDDECGCGHDHDEHEHHHEHHHDHDHECGCGHDHHDHHHHHADEVFTSWGKETPKKYNKEELDTILQKLSKDDSYGMILRSKGILQTEDGSWIQFDLVPGEYEIREGSADYTGRICVIGSKLKEDELEGLFF